MKPILITILLLCYAELYAQLKVDTDISIENSSIFVTLQNKSQHRMLIFNVNNISEKGSIIEIRFLGAKGDTLAMGLHSYTAERKVVLQPDETRTIKYRKGNMGSNTVHNIKVQHHIEYLLDDTVSYRKTGNYPMFVHDRTVDFYPQEIIDSLYNIRYPNHVFKEEK